MMSYYLEFCCCHILSAKPYDDFLIKIIRSKEAEISLRSKHKQKEKRERCKLVRIENHVLIGCGLMAGNIDKIPIFTGLGVEFGYYKEGYSKVHYLT